MRPHQADGRRGSSLPLIPLHPTLARLDLQVGLDETFFRLAAQFRETVSFLTLPNFGETFAKVALISLPKKGRGVREGPRREKNSEKSHNTTHFRHHDRRRSGAHAAAAEVVKHSCLQRKQPAAPPPLVDEGITRKLLPSSLDTREASEDRRQHWRLQEQPSLRRSAPAHPATG